MVSAGMNIGVIFSLIVYHSCHLRLLEKVSLRDTVDIHHPYIKAHMDVEFEDKTTPPCISFRAIVYFVSCVAIYF